MGKEMVCMLERGHWEITFAAWLKFFFFLQSSDYLMKCTTGFACIILKNHHSENKHARPNQYGASFAFSFEWQFFKENVTFTVTTKQSILHPRWSTKAGEEGAGERRFSALDSKIRLIKWRLPVGSNAVSAGNYRFNPVWPWWCMVRRSGRRPGK